MEFTISFFHQSIFTWWREYGRMLPWREKFRGQALEARGQKSVEEIHGAAKTFSVRESVFESYFATKFHRDPYRVVVSEVMLQQTQVERVLPKFTAWMKRWPTIEDFTRATLPEVLIEWKGLGYNRRARFLWLLAQDIVKQKHGVWPESEQELLKLPGVGKYTARAILSFAFGKHVGVVDTNVKRIFTRWCNVEQPNSCFSSHSNKKGENSKSEARSHSAEASRDMNSKEIRKDFKAKMKYQKENSQIRNLILEICEKEGLSKNTEKEWFQLADVLLPVSADPWNQALMDFGALVCTAKNPKCEECPVSQFCMGNIWARGKGFATYGAYLHSSYHVRASRELDVLLSKERRKKGKDEGLKFEETDRFFRGKILDELREKSLTTANLFIQLNHKFALSDAGRFEQLIQQLEKEQMVSVKNGIVRLG